MLNANWTQQQWLEIMHYLRSHFKPVTFAEAKQMAEEEWIKSIVSHSALTYDAIVGGRSNHHVQIDLQGIKHSSCSCHLERNCAHAAAVFIALAQFQGIYPNTFIDRIYSELYTTQLSSVPRGRPSAAASLQQPIQQDSDPQLEQLDAAAIEINTVADWHRALERSASKLKLNDLPLETLLLHVKNISRQMPDKSWSAPLKALFDCHILLFTMQLTQTLLEQGKSISYTYYIKPLRQQLTSELMALLNTFHAEEMNSSCPQQMAETSAFLHARIRQLKIETIVPWETVYQFLWSQWLHTDDSIQTEQQRLSLFLREPIIFEYAAAVGKNLLVYLFALEGNHAKAIELLSEAAVISDWTPIYELTNLAIQQNNKSAVQEWIDWLTPHVVKDASGRRNVQILSLLWFWLIDHGADAAAYGDLLRRLLPGSFTTYADYLYDSGHYRLWIDLQMVYGIDPLQHYAQTLKEIEKADPAILLPYYHQSVERLIAYKSRAHYKDAVKLLKRLAIIYKKLKKLQQWELILKQLAAKHARLRSLQEELRKGKLIS